MSEALGRCLEALGAALLHKRGGREGQGEDARQVTLAFRCLYHASKLPQEPDGAGAAVQRGLAVSIPLLTPALLLHPKLQAELAATLSEVTDPAGAHNVSLETLMPRSWRTPEASSHMPDRLLELPGPCLAQVSSRPPPADRPRNRQNDDMCTLIRRRRSRRASQKGHRTQASTTCDGSVSKPWA